MSNNSEPSDNNKENIELNNLYNRYFSNPRNIDQVYNQPANRPYLAGGVIGGFIYDKTNAHMHNIEKTIQQVYYRLPSLSFPAFFDVNHMRSDLQKGRVQEITEIYNAIKMMISDVDKIKSIDTKKRILYYCKTLAKATDGCDISKQISALISIVERKNNINTFNAKEAVMAEKQKECLAK